MDERHSAPRTDRLVLRVEISAEEGSPLGADAIAAGLQRLVPAAPAPAPEVPDHSAERLELEEREAGLRAREAEVEARLAAAEREHAARLAELERRAAEREAEHEADRVSRDGLTASEKIRLAQRTKRATELEEELGERMREVDEREELLDTREAEFEADVELREQRMERWRAELSELEQRLERKESELLLYVGEVQSELSRREVGWWPTGPAPGTVRHH